MSIKFHEDHYYDNEYCAMVGGISGKEMNLLENEILNLLEYDLIITKSRYHRYLKAMKQYYEQFVHNEDSNCSKKPMEDLEESTQDLNNQ